MITKEELSEDQQASFTQMTSEGGYSEEEALALIQELCVDKGYTGLKSTQYKLSPEGRKAALDLLPELSAAESHSIN